MEPIPVVVKHQGKKYDVELDPSSTGETFKFQLYSLTGVEPERQKILVKGGQLKDDTDLSKLNVKPGHTFMMMGTPSNDTKAKMERPKEQIKFLEDMTEAEAAQAAGAIPAGLQNLGNTCYMNSTLQTLKAIPELQTELARYKASGSGSAGPSDLRSFGLGGLGASSDLTEALRDLFKQMSETQQGFPPMMFLNALRTAFPQFAQPAREGRGYAQQDAEEAWSQIVTQLRQKLKIKEGDSGDVSFVDKYMSGKFESRMECDEQAAKDAGEQAIESQDTFFKLNCHITGEVNHLREGLAAGMVEKIEKNSEVLGRNAVYTKTSRIARLPKYLPVHFMRFDWRRDTGKKAKIMRKVTFPQELDIVEFCSEDLKKLLIPVRDKIREIRKDEEDVERARKRQKRNQHEQQEKEELYKGKGPAGEKKLAKEKEAEKKASGSSGDVEMQDASFKTDAEFEAERANAIVQAKKELLALVDGKLKEDEACNRTGLYELRGVITHQGATADSGHYTSFVKKEGQKDPSTGKRKAEDGKWWWFNDDKVSEVEEDRIESLSGGGQSHSALILLYRAVPIPTTEEIAEAEEKAKSLA
ncbi:ubiquitin C-terminal hydrolase-like protein [Phyllosticta citrichinensis]|uniref:Ubiquitin carboxyl-terminal hydrolase n=1 Tax=Phyllosticta citrichinensis TaxID=1130410 RepID=A0ABR1XTG3_9PEZI